MSLALVTMLFFAINGFYSTLQPEESRNGLCQSIAQAFAASNYSSLITKIPSQEANDSLQQFVEALPPELFYEANVTAYDSSLALLGQTSAASKKPRPNTTTWRASKKMVGNSQGRPVYARMDLLCSEAK